MQASSEVLNLDDFPSSTDDELKYQIVGLYATPDVLYARKVNWIESVRNWDLNFFTSWLNTMLLEMRSTCSYNFSRILEQDLSGCKLGHT